VFLCFSAQATAQESGAPATVARLQKVIHYTPGPDEYAIGALIADTQFKGKKVTKIIILDNTAMPGTLTSEMAKGDHQFETYLRREIPGIRLDTASDFCRKRHEVGQLEKRFPLKIPYLLLTNDDASMIFGKNDWDSFYRKYPGSQGLLFFSPIGFDRQHNQAIVYFGTQSGPSYHDGSSYLVLLVKNSNSWAIVKELTLRGSQGSKSQLRPTAPNP
jgi:hypothetical protein